LANPILPALRSTLHLAVKVLGGALDIGLCLH
jgi:hypothetical protein